MRRHLSLLNAAADNLARLRTRSLVIVFCLVAILSPFLIATAVFEAVRSQSEQSVEQGADLYVSAGSAGRNAPLPAAWAGRLAAIPGVIRAVPRVVGRDYIVGPVVVVGMPGAAVPPEVACVEGRLPAARGEALVGSELAREMGIVPGKSFTCNVNPGLRFKVVGTFVAASPMWSARLVYIDFADAQELFALPGQATEILVFTRPGYEEPVYERLVALQRTDDAEAGPGAAMPLRVVSKSIARGMLRSGFTRRAGVFSALYLVAFALAIPTIAVASGLGFSERRREIGLLRATGWHMGDVLEMVFLENLVLALAGASLSLVSSFSWMKLTNGLFLAQFFISETGARPAFEVPTSFLPLPAALGYVIAFALTMTGSLYTAYRTAVVPPMEAIR